MSGAEVKQQTLKAGVTIYSVALSPHGRNRRQAEAEAIRQLTLHVFGPEASYAHNEHGAPLIEGAEGQFVSVSHCADLCVLAVRPEGAVGVDVELWRDQLSRVAARFLDEAELELYACSEEALLKCWTAKEAVFKAAADPSLTISQVRVCLDSSTAVSKNSGRRFRIEFSEAMPRIVAVAVPES